MSTEFFNDQWRIPSNENQNKISNYSMQFDGTNYVQIGPPPNNTFLQRSEAELNATGYSVSAWIKIDSSFASTGGIFANDGIPQTSILYGLEFKINSDRTLRIDKGDGTGRFGADIRRVVTTETVPFNAWTHVAFVLTSANETTWQIYINGVPSTLSIGGSGGAVGYSSTYSGGIGRFRFEFFQGEIDQVTIFDYALSQDQVTQLGAEGYAFNFNGSTQAIDCGTGSRFDIDQITISNWVKFDSVSLVLQIMSGIRNTSNGLMPYMLSLYNNAGIVKKLRFTINQSSDSEYKSIYSNDIIVVDTWYHVVGVADGSNVKLYVNGVLQTDQTTYDGTILSPTENFNIGRQPSAPLYYLDGELSNISVFNTGLSSTDVQTLYNSGKPLADMSSFTSLQGWWKLDETATFNSGTSVWSIPDDSSNSNTGTSVGMNSSNLVASNINGELIANPMITSPKPIAYYQLGDQSVDNGANYLVPNNSLSDYVFNFSTNNESINLGNSFNYPSVVADPWTISFWVKPTNATSTGIIFSGYSVANNRGFYVNMRNWPNPTPADRRLQCIIRSNSNTYTSVVTPSLALNEWTHVAICYGGGGSGNFPYSFSVYFNNSPVSLVVAGGNLGTPAGSVGPNDNKYIGQRGDGASYLIDAELSELSFLKYKLSANQVDTLYNNGKPGDISSLNPFTSYELNASEIFNSTSTEWSVDNNAYPSVYQSSLDFNGSSNYIDTPQINLGSTNTISFWINTTTTTQGTIFGDPNGYADYALFSQPSLNRTAFRLGNNDSGYYQIEVSSGLLNDGNWHHHCLTRDGVTVNYYIDGILQTNVINNTLNASAGTNTTIENIFAMPDASFKYSGKLSNVALFNSALISSQVATIYNNGTPQASISHSPVSWWKLDNTTTGVQDSAGSNNGTNNGATEYAGFVNALAGESSSMNSSNLVVSDLQQTSGYSPYALDFDGTDNYLDTPQINLGSTNTISFWINNSAADIGTIFGDPNAFGNPPYALVQNTSTGDLTFRLGNNDAGYWRLTVSSGLLSDGNWHHHCLSRNGVTINYYIDGILQTNVTNNTLNASAGTNTTIENIMANTTLASFASGKLSNVALWNTALTSTQVTEIYNSGKPSDLNTFSGTAPVAWWQIGSNSSFNPNPTGTEGTWTCLDEIGTNNAIGSANMTNDDIVNGPGYSASGLGTSSIDIVGDAPYSTANGLSENMDVLDRVTDVAPS